MCFCQTQVNYQQLFHSEQGHVIRINELTQQDGRGNFEDGKPSNLNLVCQA